MTSLLVRARRGKSFLTEDMDKRIVFFNRFFGEKLVFGGVGKDFRVEKSEVKKSEKNRRFFR